LEGVNNFIAIKEKSDVTGYAFFLKKMKIVIFQFFKNITNYIAIFKN
jgi:hypothetical protein